MDQSNVEYARAKHMQETIHKARHMDLPSNESIVDTLEHVKSSKTGEKLTNNLSPTGKIVSKDINNLISKTQKVIMEKNSDNHFQNMMLHSKYATDHSKQTFKTQTTSPSVQPLKSSITMAYMAVVTIVKMLFTSTEFRRAMRDFMNILLDIMKYNMEDVENNEVSKNVSSIKKEADKTLSGDQSLRETAHRIVDTVSDTTERNVPEHVRDELAENVRPELQNSSPVEASKNIFSEKLNKVEIPKEKREELINRLKNALRTFQSRPEFQHSVDDLFQAINGLYESTEQYSKTQLKKGKMAVQSDTPAEKEWKTSMNHAESLIDNIFGGRSIMDVIHSIQTFMIEIREDENLLEKFRRWKQFIQEIFRNPSYIDSENFTRDSRNLTDETEKILNEHYRDYTDDIYGKTSYFMAGAEEDPTNQEFVEALRTVWNDMFFDEHGNMTLKKDLARDVSHILPIIADKIAYIPLPRYANSDNKFDIEIDELVLKCSGLIPDSLRVSADMNLDLKVPQVTGKVYVHLTNIQASAHNLFFSFKKKTFPRLSESGRLDFDILGSGLTIDLTFVPWFRLHEKGLDLVDCKVHVDKVNTVFRDVKHTILLKLFKGFIQKTVKKKIEHTLTENLVSIVDPSQHRKDNAVESLNKNDNQGENNISYDDSFTKNDEHDGYEHENAYTNVQAGPSYSTMTDMNTYVNNDKNSQTEPHRKRFRAFSSFVKG